MPVREIRPKPENVGSKEVLEFYLYISKSALRQRRLGAKTGQLRTANNTSNSHKTNIAPGSEVFRNSSSRTIILNHPAKKRG